jgi:UDP-N-acetylglucosamine--N-acetylmuramyl-(pentapeptide) pyrophosphoryl-undecaprenol N-acetylglucosamine transferase
MKIVLTGGGTGGHFYPIIAVAEAIHEVIAERKLLEPELIYMAPHPYDEHSLFESDIRFVAIPAGKRRGYRSWLNVLDTFRMGWGVLWALWRIYTIFPDVVFAKGGYASFPVLVAARFFGIPVVIHESDSVPGRVSAWAGKFAKRIAVSYAAAGEFFPTEKVAHTGQPIRRDLRHAAKAGAFEFLHLEGGLPVLLVLGGSQGAAKINDAIINALPRLVEHYQIIHQVGKANLAESRQLALVMLEGNTHKDRYRQFDFLEPLALKMAAGAADLVVSRAGSTIFEIATWGVPSIVIPITDSIHDHQRKNAFAYARAGAALVIEESNLTADILAYQIDALFADPAKMQAMQQAAQGFAPQGAAYKIASGIVDLGLEHER